MRETDASNEGGDWQRWLTKRYGKLLRDEVARRNRIELGSATARQRDRFDAFVEGASDLL